MNQRKPPLLRSLAQTVKNLSAIWETWVPSLGWEDPWRKAWQPTPVFLPGEFPWTEEPDGLQSMASQRVSHDWATMHAAQHTCGHRRSEWKVEESCGFNQWWERQKGFYTSQGVLTHGHVHLLLNREFSHDRWRRRKVHICSVCVVDGKPVFQIFNLVTF